MKKTANSTLSGRAAKPTLFSILWTSDFALIYGIKPDDVSIEKIVNNSMFE